MILLVPMTVNIDHICLRYASVFWNDGPSVFGPSDWEKIVKQVEKV